MMFMETAKPIPDYGHHACGKMRTRLNVYMSIWLSDLESTHVLECTAVLKNEVIGLRWGKIFKIYF